MSDHLIQAVLEALEDPRHATEIARRLQPYLSTDAAVDRWLDTKAAAAYLGLTRNALHKLTAARTIPFEQDAAGGKCWFKQSKLDQWRQGRRVLELGEARRAA